MATVKVIVLDDSNNVQITASGEGSDNYKLTQLGVSQGPLLTFPTDLSI